MSTYSHQAQRELDAASFAEDDKRRAAPTRWRNRPRLSNPTVPAETEIDEDVRDSIFDAICNSDGRADAYHMRLQLARRGLLIVEAAKYSAALLRSQLVESTVATIKGE